MPDLTGQSLGRYHILEQLGEGGMATVYKAYDTRLERDVAVKVIRRGAFPPDQLERILKRFEREAKALGRLTHPNIVPVIDYGEHEGSPYLVMPYLPGGTLKQRLGKPKPWKKAVKLLIPVAEALEYAHSQGIVHRDIKPANILLMEQEQPMLTDFGIAKLLEAEEGNTLTATGVGIGTPEYMSPEQWTGHATAQSDIYSLGVVLFEMLTGVKPYTADTPPAIMLKQATEPLPRPTRLITDLPEGVEKVLLKAMAKAPEDRYASMSAFTAALEGLLSDSPQVEGTGEAGEQPVSDTDTMATLEQDAPGATVLQQGEEKTPQPKKPAGWESPPPPPQVKKKAWLPWALGGGGLLGFCILAAILIAVLYFKDQPANQASPSIASTISSESVVVLPTTAPTTSPTVGHATVYPKTPRLDVGSTWTRPADGMVMVYVPEGEFTMGSTGREPDEAPPHTVYLDNYWIDQTEVTNALYSRCVSAGGCNPPYDFSSYSRSSYYENSSYRDFPVIWVSWNDATAYCEWADARLPSEAEWEKAARGIDSSLYPWGNAPADCNLSNFGGPTGCIGDTSEVGSFPAGASVYGALDLAGNVWEWVTDWYDAYPGGDRGESEDYGTTVRVMRGGSWAADAEHARSAFRNWGDPALSSRALGFRCSRSTSP